MNAATALGRVLVDELVRCGVREAVLAPGSRSAPLALALHDADAGERLRLHVRVDERSAGFLAVGLAKASYAPVAVVCTSGTAAANLHPAVLEAAHAHVPLLLLTADRPPELRGTGANQTTDQLGLYGPAVRLFLEVGVPEVRAGAVAYWRSMTARAVAAAYDGPVHLNLALREPLVPDGSDDWPEPLAGRPGGAPWTRVARAEPAGDALPGGYPARGALVVGEGARPGDVERAGRLAERCGWPVLSEPTGGARLPGSIGTYPLLLADPRFVARHRPDVVVSVGKPGLSRSLLTWLRTAGLHVVVDPHADWADPTRTASVVVPAVPDPPDPPDPPDLAVAAREPGWLDGWRSADRCARAAVDAVLDESDAPSEPRAARDLVAAAGDGALLVAGSSRPIRDLEAYAAPRAGLRVLGNRGVSGIDGLVSTAIGAALAHQRAGGGAAYALLGDLTLLHDAGGLVLGPDEPRPDLTIVVVSNDGGGIFSTLEQAGEPGFERVFGTPHGVDPAALAAAHGLAATVVRRAGDLPLVVRRAGGLRLVVVPTERAATAALHRRIQAAVSAAL